MTQASAKRTSLLAGCGSAALALGLILGPAPASAQGIQANGNVTFGSATINDSVPGQTTVSVSTPTVVIDWSAREDAMGNPLPFLPNGGTANFRNNAAAQVSQFAVLNRILPADGNLAAVIDGNVISRIFDITGAAAPGGFVAFYSPTGILVGNNATFDVGQLMLTTLDVTSGEEFRDFTESGQTLQLVGAPGSTAQIRIQPGAQIQALADNAFFAVVAADVEMLGTARVNGSHAYVAGEVVNLTFNNGLFNIQVPVGTAAAGQVVTLDGTVGGPSSTGVGDNHLIYAVARASSDPISMLLRGNLGFDPAQSAGIVNGEIIISANYNVFGRTVDGGSVSDGINATFAGNSELTDVRADIFLEDFAASSSLLAIGTHRTQVTARTTASSVAGNLIMVGRQNSELTASNGQSFTITGDVLVSAQDYGVSGSGLQSLEMLNATGGVAFIDAFGGGSLRINGSALVAADAFAGAEGSRGLVGTATAGQALIGSTGGTLVIDGDATVTARGVGPSGTSFFSNALTGADARGGLAQFFSVQGGNVTLGGTLLLDASASATGSLEIATTTASNAFGGNAFLNVFNGAGSITIGNGATVRANATGGDANFAGLGGTGDAGQAIVDVNGTGVIDITGNVITEAFGIGGDNRAGTGGNGLGGRAAATTIGGGQILIDGSYSADAIGRGGNGVNGGNGLGGIAIGIARTGLINITGGGQVFADGIGGDASFSFGGNGGIGRGGNAAFQANGTLNQSATLAIGGDASVFATGTGGQGGAAFIQTGTPAPKADSMPVAGGGAAFIQTGTPAGRGGDGFGGDFGTPNQADPAFNSGAFLLAGGDRGNLTISGSAIVTADAVGGSGGAGQSTLNGGQGGNATGGLAQVGLALLDGNGSVGLGVANFGRVLAFANGFGGVGGLTLDVATGNGGTGTGGFAAFTVRAGEVNATDIVLGATGSGGAGQTAGSGTGGAAAVLGSLGGSLTATSISASASGAGGGSLMGTGGNGLGGEAAIEIDGISVTITDGVALDAGGSGGFSEFGVAGNGTGGLAYVASNNPAAPGSISVTGHTAIIANGLGGSSNTFAAGNGTGGTAYVDALGGSTISLGTAQLVAIGSGGNSTTHEGGDGTGGTVRLLASGVGSQLTIARNVPAAFAPGSGGAAPLIDASGFGGESFGGDGVGGVGQGGTIAVTAEQGGTVDLPVNLLADPARSSDRLEILALGMGGASGVTGGTGGEGRGGSITLLVDSGTLTAGPTTLSTFARGGTSLDSTINVTGGNATGGTRAIRVINTGTLTYESSDTAVPIAARGGDGSGTGNGGTATSGLVLFEVTDSIANLTGLLNLANRTVGGNGAVGGDAMLGAGPSSVMVQSSAINFLPDANGRVGLRIDTTGVGGTGVSQGGSARGSDIDISIRNSTFLNGALSVSTGAMGGNADQSTGIGGNAQAGAIQIFTNPSTISLVGSNIIDASATGGNAATGGSAVAGSITAELNETEVTVVSDINGISSLQFVSQAVAGQGINLPDPVSGGLVSGVGDATSGDVTLQLVDSTINALDLALLTSATAESLNSEVAGGTAMVGDTLLSLSGASQINVDSLSQRGLGVTSFGQRQVQIGVDPMGNPIFGTVFDFSGQTFGGFNRLVIEANSTALINASQIEVISDTFGGIDFAGRFSIEVLSGEINTFDLNASTSIFSNLLDDLASEVVVRGGALLAQNAFFSTDRNLNFITSNGGIIGSDASAGSSNSLSAFTRGTITVTGEGADRGLIGGGSITLDAGRSILLDGTLASAGGDINLFANNFSSLFVNQPEPNVVTMSDTATIDAGDGTVTIRLFDGATDPQRQTGAITLSTISAGTIDVRHFGTSPGSDIFVVSNGVLTASGIGRAIDLASLHGEVINLAGDAGLILTGGGHFGIFAESPEGSQIGSLDNYQRRYGVPDAVAYDAIDLGGNFAAFRFTPVITVTAADFSRFYGDPDPALGAFFDGFLPGDSIADVLGAPEFFVSADQFSDIGTYLIETGLGSLFSVQGYAFQFLPGTLTIDPRPITVTANDLSRIYGNGNPALTFSVGGLGLVNGDQLFGDLETQANITSGVGSFAISQGTLNASSNYALTFVDGTLTVTPRPITITADSFSRVYGNANPALTFVLGGQGLVNGDQLTGALATTAGLTSGVGSYAITQGTLSAGANYTVTYNAGAITVNPRPITITADNLSRIYGNANPALTFTVGGLGLVNGDQITGALANAAGQTTGVGSSAITLGTLAATANYAVTFVPGTLTITPRPLTVAASNLSKTLGFADPLLTFSITAGDLVNGDQLSGSLVRDPGETIASFVIRQGTLSAGGNYTLTFVPGTFTINPPPVSQEINNPTIFEPSVVIASTPPPVAGEVEERFGIDFPEQPEAPLISEDPLLDDPVATGGDSSVYGAGGSGAATAPAGGQ
jgi:hypothetical protein